MKKKGQVTVFIIIGIVLLLAIGIFFALREREPIEIPVASKFRPVQDYVESCISLIAREGLDIQGKNGGYIEFPDEVKYNARSYLSSDLFGNMQNPYWHYDGINNTPTLEITNKQLKDYITARVMPCLSDFSGFKDFNVTPLASLPVITVIYGEEDTIIKAEYPLRITDLNTGEVNEDMKNFNSFIPIRFKKVFEIAASIQASQDKDFFLEDKVLDLIAMAPEDEIPYTGIAFECGRKTWSKKGIKERLKRLVQFNFPYIKFSGLPYDKERFISVPEKPDTFENSYYNFHYIWDAGITPNNDIKATVFFDSSFPFTLYANPSKGDKMSSNSQDAQQMLSFLCLNIWHFTYDIKFPVIIRIKDFKDSQDYVFEYATQVSINHNLPDHKNIGRTITDPIASADESEYCKTDASDKMINVIARNKATGLEVQGANITFVCGFMACNLGITSLQPDIGNLPAVRQRSPYCVNAVLKASAKDYLDAAYFSDVNTAVENTYYIDMEAAKEFNEFYIVKHLLNDNGDVSPLENPLSAQEIASIMVEVKDNPDISYFLAFPIPFTEESGIAPLKLYTDEPKAYHVTIHVSKEGQITAAYEADWTPNTENVKSSNKIKFHVLEPARGDDEKQYLFLQGLGSYSQKAPAPELIT